MVMYAKTSGSTEVSTGRAVQLLQNPSEVSAASNALTATIRSRACSGNYVTDRGCCQSFALFSAANYHRVGPAESGSKACQRVPPAPLGDDYQKCVNAVGKTSTYFSVWTTQNWAQTKKRKANRWRLLVRKGGLEPPRFYPPDPKSGASANSATFAPGETFLPSLAKSSTLGHYRQPIGYKVLIPLSSNSRLN